MASPYAGSTCLQLLGGCQHTLVLRSNVTSLASQTLGCAVQELEYPDGHVSPSIYVTMPLTRLADSLSPEQASALDGTLLACHQPSSHCNLEVLHEQRSIGRRSSWSHALLKDHSWSVRASTRHSQAVAHV